MPKLVISEEGGTREVGLTSGDSLGRTSQNAIVLKVPEASRRHCVFTLEQNSWFIEDQGSSNGTQVNGRKVTKFELQDGDTVQIGKATLRFLETEVEEELELSLDDGEISLEDEVFLILGGAGRDGDIVNLPSGRVTVGRNAKNAIIIKDRSISGDHAELVREGDEVKVKDLGSSNGTFVDGRKVDEVTLQSGDVVTFGAIPCTFGVGEPSHFSAPSAPPGGHASDEYTTAMEIDDLGDATFELSEGGRKSSLLGTVFSLLLLAGLGGAVWYFMNYEPAQAGGPVVRVDRGSNLLSPMASSFELPQSEEEEAALDENDSWDKVDSGDPGDLDLVGDTVVSGGLAARVERREDIPAPTLFRHGVAINVTANSTYLLSGYVAQASAIPVLGVLWLEERQVPGLEEGTFETQLNEIARSVVWGQPVSDWKELLGFVVAPSGATRMQFAVGLGGSGGATFDDVSLVSRPAPAGRRVTVDGFEAALSAQGSLRLTRYGHGIIDGLGVYAKQGDNTLSQDALFSASDPEAAQRLEGTLRGERGSLAAQLSQDGDQLAYQLSGDGLSRCDGLIVPLVFEDTAPRVTVITGMEAKRMERAFEGMAGDALIVGERGRLARLKLKSSAGEDVAFTASLVIKEDSAQPAFVMLKPNEALTGLKIEFQLKFQNEEAEARALLAEAKGAARRSQYGKALGLADQLVARFPFQESLESEAGALRKKLLEQGRDSVASLTTRVDDAVFFRTLMEEKGLDKDVMQELGRFAGSSVEKPLQALKQRLSEERRNWNLPLRKSDAARALNRAKAYMKSDKKQLAQLFIEAIQREYADLEEAAKTAKQLEAQLGAGASSGKKGGD